MKKKTTSDEIKLSLVESFGGAKADWKRGDKSKNAEGETVREFANAALGRKVTVIEDTDGRLRLEEGAPAAAKSTPALVTDAAANTAADKAVDIIMGDAPSLDDDDKASWGVPNELLAEAGKALANRHCFAICDETGEGDLTALITPIRHFEKRGACSDQSGPLQDLLPRCAETMESTWECYDEKVKTPVDFARHLQALGFQWSRDFQDFIDKKLIGQIDAAVEAYEGDPSKQSPVAKVMKIVRDGNDEGNNEIPERLLEKCDPKELASQFYFVIRKFEEDEFDANLVAVIAPKGEGTDESKSSISIMEHLFPEAEYIDDCVEGWWAFPAKVDTPLKLAQKLVNAGFNFDLEDQDENLQPELKGLKTAPVAKKQKTPKP